MPSSWYHADISILQQYDSRCLSLLSQADTIISINIIIIQFQIDTMLHLVKQLDCQIHSSLMRHQRRDYCAFSAYISHLYFHAHIKGLRIDGVTWRRHCSVEVNDNTLSFRCWKRHYQWSRPKHELIEVQPHMFDGAAGHFDRSSGVKMVIRFHIFWECICW